MSMVKAISHKLYPWIYMKIYIHKPQYVYFDLSIR